MPRAFDAIVGSRMGGKDVVRSTVVFAVIALLFLPQVGLSQARILDYGAQGFTDDSVKKVDPWLRMMATSPTQELQRFGRVAGLKAQEGEPPLIEVLIKTKDLSALRDLGIAIGSVHGGIVTARIPVTSVSTIAGIPETEYVEAGRLFYETLDVSVPETGADLVWAMSTPTSSDIRGEGVLIGIMDSGIDWTHLDFIDESGGAGSHVSRILRIWDQTITDPNFAAPGAYGYGAEYTQADLNNAINGGSPVPLTENTGSGHGSHVAGIAAGDGSSTPTGYVGMAPEANLIVVENTGDALWSYGASAVGALDGFDYMMNVASSLGMPLVVNQSQALTMGPHDGTTLYEQALDADINSGMVYVAAAGNRRDDDMHAEGNVAVGSPVTVTFDVGSLDYTLDIPLEVWYEGGLAFDIEIQSPNQGWSAPVTPGTSATLSFGADGDAHVDATDFPSALNGDNRIAILLDNGGSPVEPGNWQIRLTSSDGVSAGEFDAWFERNRDVRFTDHVDVEETLGMPGTSTEAITVASYNTKVSWISNNGPQSYIGPPTVGDISWFSSVGPRRDGYMKPEISAPGAGIASVLSSDAGVSGDWILAETPANQHRIMQGTSMSAPHVTGAIALMLQADPTLTQDDIKQLLMDTARLDAFTGTPPVMEDWGAGKLDINAAMLRIVGITADVDFDPNTLNLKSLGKWVTCYIELPEGFDPADIDVSTVMLNGVVPAELSPTDLGDHDSDGIPDRMVKFGREEFIAFIESSTAAKTWVRARASENVALADGSNFGIEVSGELNDGTPLEGTDTIWIQTPGNDAHPAGGAEPEEPAVASLERPVLEVFPSPLTGTAKISYGLTVAGPVRLAIYDAAGRLVRTLESGHRPAGMHAVTWDRKADNGRQVHGGVYFIRFVLPGVEIVRKLMVLK